MVYIDTSKIKKKRGYVGASGVAPHGSPLFSHTATVSMGSGVPDNGKDSGYGEIPEVNVPDNPEFRAAYVRWMKKYGMTDEEIEFCLKYNSASVKKAENYVAYCHGEIEPCAGNLAQLHHGDLRTFVDRLRSRGYEAEELFVKLED